MRVLDPEGALVHDHPGALEPAGGVVVAADHALEVLLALRRRAAIDEEGLLGFGGIDGHRDMLHRVGPEAAGILVAIVGVDLAEGEPDAPVAVDDRQYLLRERFDALSGKDLCL